MVDGVIGLHLEIAPKPVEVEKRPDTELVPTQLPKMVVTIARGHHPTVWAVMREVVQVSKWYFFVKEVMLNFTLEYLFTPAKWTHYFHLKYILLLYISWQIILAKIFSNYAVVYGD